MGSEMLLIAILKVTTYKCGRKVRVRVRVRWCGCWRWPIWTSSRHTSAGSAQPKHVTFAFAVQMYFDVILCNCNGVLKASHGY